MLKVSDIMTTDVLTLSPDMTLREAVERLDGGEVSGAPVVASGEVVGVLSQTDLLAFEASEMEEPAYGGGSSQDEAWPLVEIVDEPADDDPGAYFAEFGHESHASLTEYFRDPSVVSLDRLEDHSVGEVMTRRAVAVPSGAPLEEAARTMVKGGIHRVLVMDERKLAGILTSSDFVRAAAEKRLTG